MTRGNHYAHFATCKDCLACRVASGTLRRLHLTPLRTHPSQQTPAQQSSASKSSACSADFLNGEASDATEINPVALVGARLLAQVVVAAQREHQQSSCYEPLARCCQWRKAARHQCRKRLRPPISRRLHPTAKTEHEQTSSASSAGPAVRLAEAARKKQPADPCAAAHRPCRARGHRLC